MNEYKRISSKRLAGIIGGSNSDYNLGYGLGYGFRNFTNSVARQASGFARWCRKRF